MTEPNYTSLGIPKSTLPDYDIYLEGHMKSVHKAAKWMWDHYLIPHMPDFSQFEDLRIFDHDISKYSPEEYSAYDDYFYHKEGKDEDDIAVIDSAFDYAWLHHIHANPHHWQHWVLIGDDDGPKALEMPKRYVYEMIADWWSFSWKSGNLKEIFDWYDNHKEKMVLHENTRNLVEELLNKIKTILEKEEEEQNGNG